MSTDTSGVTISRSDEAPDVIATVSTDRFRGHERCGVEVGRVRTKQ
jgi:hypothetical protein